MRYAVANADLLGTSLIDEFSWPFLLIDIEIADLSHCFLSSSELDLFIESKNVISSTLTRKICDDIARLRGYERTASRTFESIRIFHFP
jgi:hypothetical protein